MITLELPVPPTINHYYGRNGVRTFLTKSCKVFRHMVATAVNDAGHRGYFGEQRLAMDITLHLPSRRGDIDNRIKPLLDALEHANLFDNDRQVDSLKIHRGECEKPGKCVVRVWACD